MFERRGYFQDILDHQKSVNVLFLERSNSNKSESQFHMLFHFPWFITCSPEHGSHTNQTLITHLTIYVKFEDIISMM